MAFGPTGDATCLRRCARWSIPANARACLHIKPSRRPFRLSALCSNQVEQLQGGTHSHDHCMFCLCTPAMYEPPMHAFSLHVSRGYTDQQHSQPVHGSFFFYADFHERLTSDED